VAVTDEKVIGQRNPGRQGSNCRKKDTSDCNRINGPKRMDVDLPIGISRLKAIAPYESGLNDRRKFVGVYFYPKWANCDHSRLIFSVSRNVDIQECQDRREKLT